MIDCEFCGHGNIMHKTHFSGIRCNVPDCGCDKKYKNPYLFAGDPIDN